MSGMNEYLQLVLTKVERLQSTSVIQFTKTILLIKFILQITCSIYKKGLLQYSSEIIKLATKKTIKFVRKTLPIEGIIQNKIKKQIDDIQKDMVVALPGKKYDKLPKAQSISEVIAQLEKFSGFHVKHSWEEGKVSGTVYHGGTDITKLLTRAFELNIYSNPLHPETFPFVRKMEAEIVSMVSGMYNGFGVGSITSGGSESIILAVKTYRDWALETKSITEPEMVIPVSAHAAFDKAAQYFKVKVVHVPVDADGRVNISSVSNSINSNTIMLVGSTPSFPHGAIDDIPKLSELALKHNLGLHIDSCLGGFIVPFMKDAGYPLPHLTDFRLSGVTSISCDPHKYGFAPKGSSVVLYRSKELRKFQYFVQPDWTGGVYGSPTMAGSRSGAISAGCWAAMVHFGQDGYTETTREIIKTARMIKQCVEEISELEVIGDCLLSVVAFKSASKEVDIFGVSDLLHAKGYSLNVLQYPAAIHIACTILTTGIVEELCKDLKEVVQKLKETPGLASGSAAKIYGSAAAVPDRDIIGDVICGFLDGLTMM